MPFQYFDILIFETDKLAFCWRIYSHKSSNLLEEGYLIVSERSSFRIDRKGNFQMTDFWVTKNKRSHEHTDTHTNTHTSIAFALHFNFRPAFSWLDCR